MEQAEIGIIRQRVKDLSEALRVAEAAPLAERIEGYAKGFTHVTEVRRCVNQIAEQLAIWREIDSELPDSASVLVAANRLEDACQAALKGGVIAPARPSLRTQAKRKVGLAAKTLMVGGAALAVPALLFALGVRPDDFLPVADMASVPLVQAEEAHVEVRMLEPPEQPARALHAEIGPLGGCQQGKAGHGGCNPVGARSWPPGDLATFEQRLPNQAYGLQFALEPVAYDDGTGRATLWLAASVETPPGTYRIPLSGAYLGYAPDCPVWKDLVGLCDAPADPPRHEDVPVRSAVVEVSRATPEQLAARAARAERKAKLRQERAQARAALIAESVDVIEPELDRSEALLARGKHEALRERLDKLDALLAPLDELAIEQLKEAALPEVVGEVRARVDGLRQKNAAFEEELFDATFAALHADRADKLAEAHLMTRVARRFRVSTDYVEAVYVARPDDIQARLDEIAQSRRAERQAAQSALRKRCGPVPLGAFRLVQGYLDARHGRSGERVAVEECRSPHLTASHCWQMTCDYRVVRDLDGRIKVTKLRASFRLRDGRVVSHGDPG